MGLNARTLLFSFLIILGLWFIYAERAILTPFIIAAIFAYLFNPVVNLFTHKLRVPRVISILLIYCFLLTILILGGITLSSLLVRDSSELHTFTIRALNNIQNQIRDLPTWLQPTAYDLLKNLKHSRFLGFVGGQSFFPVFSQAISRIISFFIFLFSAFYFLKDGEKFFQKIVNVTPNKYKNEVENLLKKMNAILSGYLRGQIFLVFLMSLVTYIALLILGVRFAFLLGVFSGFAEIVPVVGPIVAATVAILTVITTGTVHFGLSPLQGSIIIAVIYFVLRHMEDYFVMPYVYGKITQLPSFLIFFAVVAGGHIGGVLGLILAVPVAAILQLLLQFFLTKVNGNSSRK